MVNVSETDTLRRGLEFLVNLMRAEEYNYSQSINHHSEVANLFIPNIYRWYLDTEARYLKLGGTPLTKKAHSTDDTMPRVEWRQGHFYMSAPSPTDSWSIVVEWEKMMTDYKQYN